MDNEKRELIVSIIEYFLGRNIHMGWLAGSTTMTFNHTVTVDNGLFNDNLLLTCCNVADDLSRLPF